MPSHTYTLDVTGLPQFHRLIDFLGVVRARAEGTDDAELKKLADDCLADISPDNEPDQEVDAT